MGVLLKIIEYAKSGIGCENISDSKEYFTKIIELAEMEEKIKGTSSQSEDRRVQTFSKLFDFLLERKDTIFLSSYEGALYLNNGKGLLVKLHNFTCPLDVSSTHKIMGDGYVFEAIFRKAHRSEQFSIDWMMPSWVQVNEDHEVSACFKVGKVSYNARVLKHVYELVGGDTSGKYWISSMQSSYFRSSAGDTEVLLLPTEVEG